MKALTLWIDITELFGQFALSHHPTGISRVILNLADALAAERGELFANVRAIAWHPVWRLPIAFDGAAPHGLAAFFPALRDRYAQCGREMRWMPSGLRKGLMTSVPKPFRYRLFPFLNGVTHFVGWAREVGVRVRPVEFSRHDCLFVPGSFWLDGYAPGLAALAKARGAAVAGFVHDLLLLSNPQFFPRGHAEQFRRGVEAFLPHCSVVACNSVHTRDELRVHAALANDIPIEVCRLADARTILPATEVSGEVAALLGKRYALFVSTLTPRKNHCLAVEAWLHLQKMLGSETPLLVFAGGGGPDARLGQALSQATDAGARVIWLKGISDSTLETLYAHAWITLYPSLGEGYGMPVAEALARGKVCLATRCGGLADVAPDLIDAIDAHDHKVLVDRVLAYALDPSSLAAREAEIRGRYRPTHWADTARCVRGLLERAVRALG